jgi:hypothetical protein
MTGIFDRMKSIAGADTTQVVDFAHTHFQGRMAEHGHFGQALVETVVELCRKHPNLVGIAAGVMVERLLVAEKQHHEEFLQETSATTAEGNVVELPRGKKPPKAAKTGHHELRLNRLRPGRIAFEVFGALLLLKMAASGARIFRHKHQGEVWFAPAAKIHLFSATLCAYNLTKALRSPRVSAWRNGAVLLFGTDAIKPVLKWYRLHPAHSWAKAPAETVAAPGSDPALAAPEPTPDHVYRAPETVVAAPEAAPVASPAVFGFSLPAQDNHDPSGQTFAH